MIPVEIVAGVGGGGMKESSRGGIVTTFVNPTVYRTP
jgi:hypothetical protein